MQAMRLVLEVFWVQQRLGVPPLPSLLEGGDLRPEAKEEAAGEAPAAAAVSGGFQLGRGGVDEQRLRSRLASLRRVAREPGWPTGDLLLVVRHRFGIARLTSQCGQLAMQLSFGILKARRQVRAVQRLRGVFAPGARQLLIDNGILR